MTVAVLMPDESVLVLPAVTVAPDGVQVRVIAAPAMALLLQSVTVTVIVAVSGVPEALIDAMSVVSLVFRLVSTVTLALDVPSEKPDLLCGNLDLIVTVIRALERGNGDAIGIGLPGKQLFVPRPLSLRPHRRAHFP